LIGDQRGNKLSPSLWHRFDLSNLLVLMMQATLRIPARQAGRVVLQVAVVLTASVLLSGVGMADSLSVVSAEGTERPLSVAAEPHAGDAETAEALPGEANDSWSSEWLDELWSLWEVRRSEISTARIRYRDYRAVPAADSAPTAEEFRALVESVDLAARPDDLREILARVSTELPDRDPPWKMSLLTVEGRRVRWVYPPFDSLIDGDLEFHFDGDNNQVGVYPLGKARRLVTQVTDFRYVPSASIDRGYFQWTGRAENGVWLTGSVSRSLVDEATGLFLWDQTLRSGSGEVLRESWEQGIVEYPGDIPFPTVSIRAVYRSGRLASAWFRIVEEAQFNVDLDPGEFQLATAADVKVIDYRGEQKDVRLLRQPTSDLRAALWRQYRVAGERTSLAQGDRLRWLLAVNAVVLLGLSLYLWNSGRQRRRQPFQLHLRNREEVRSPQPRDRSP
jgi:hypothetical protein